jgi:hypothetical protein
MALGAGTKLAIREPFFKLMADGCLAGGVIESKHSNDVDCPSPPPPPPPHHIRILLAYV